MIPLNNNINKTFTPPIEEAFNWLENIETPKKLKLLNLSQAAPMNPPPKEICQAIAHASLNKKDAHLYGPILGNNDLRKELSTKWNKIYNAKINSTNIGITSGSNQAFCAALTSIASPGDNIILTNPWYFNHKMWLDISSIKSKIIPLNNKMLPDPKNAKKLIDQKTKAILLVSPNNPTGVEYPKELLLEFFKLAKKNNIMLILDETYRDFHSSNDPIHTLFQQKNWENNFISLYSFSKSYRLTGHRIGAVFTKSERLKQIEKFLDTVTICPNQLGQIGALYGLRESSSWLRDERKKILNKKDIVIKSFKNLDRWKLKSCGAYFAYIEHPFNKCSNIICKKLLSKSAILSLPETMFTPVNNKVVKNHIRIAFANINLYEIKEMFERLKIFKP